MTLAVLVDSPDFRIVVRDAQTETINIAGFLDNVPPAEVEKAQELLAHLLEVRTGFRMGNAPSALPGEPRARFDPANTTLTERTDAKAHELGCTRRSIQGLLRQYDQQGLFGLVDQRAVRLAHDRIDSRIKQVVRAVLDEITDLSNVSKNQIGRRAARKLKELHPEEGLAIPPQSTFNRLLDELTNGRGTFGSGKARRSIANRPGTSYSHFVATRPGEMVLIDSTPLDAYGLDPYSFRWVQMQLTIAYDLFSRSILAWRFTPVSTKAVDAALLLYDVVRPKLVQPGWPESARWPYVGVPESIVLELVGDHGAEHSLAGIPFVHPESVLVDRGRVFLSQAFSDACTRLGINLFIARPYTPTDKAHVERVFRSIREAFVENLPGYRGPDVFSRGARVEEGAFFFLDEIECRFAEWVASYWQRRHHGGLELPHAPRLHLSPNDMYEEGIARAGFVYLVPDEHLYYELLPTEWRTIQHYGVEVHGLRYDGDILNDFRNDTSPYTGVHSGKWPLRFDPRDLSRVFFYDHTLNQWYTLNWIGASPTPRPFDAATLNYAKSLVIARGGNARNHDEMIVTLHELLNRIDDETLIGRKERRLAAINAIQTSNARKDRPTISAPRAPDDEASVLPAGPIASRAETAHSGNIASKKLGDIPIYRTLDEAMEDDDDALSF